MHVCKINIKNDISIRFYSHQEIADLGEWMCNKNTQFIPPGNNHCLTVFASLFLIFCEWFGRE